MKGENKKQWPEKESSNEKIQNQNQWAKNKDNVSMEDPELDKSSLGSSKIDWD